MSGAEPKRMLEQAQWPPQPARDKAAVPPLASPAALPGGPPAVGNPFSTRPTRPGALSYLFSPGETPETILSRLESQGWWGEIVGPHGSGKSTLLATLVGALQDSGRRPITFAMHDRQRSLPVDLEARADLDAARLIVVDGYEQLGRWNRLRLKRLCRRRGWGLLVTVHASVGLPRLCETAVSVELAQRVVEQLLTASGRPPLASDQIARSYEHAGGNLREMLFDLYDLFERAPRR